MEKGFYRSGHWEDITGFTPSIHRIFENKRPCFGKTLRMKWPLWVIDYSYNDSGLFCLPDFDKRWKKRQCNTMHIYAPLTEYHEHSEPGEYLMHSGGIVFSGGDLLGLNTLVGKKSGLAEVNDPSGTLGAIIQDGARRAEGVEFGKFMIAQTVLFSLAQALFKCRELADGYWEYPANDSPAMPFEAMIDDYLSRNLHRKLTREKLAARFNMSLSGLSHRYREASGQGVMQRLMELRIMRVKAMLTVGSPLQYIAEMTGFGDAYHLSKAFKKNTGIAPAEYRRQHCLIVQDKKAPAAEEDSSGRGQS